VRITPGLRRSIDTDSLPPPSGSTLAEFLKRVAKGEIGSAVPRRELASPEEDAAFLPGKSLTAQDGSCAISAGEPTGSALAVFVPIEDLAR